MSGVGEVKAEFSNKPQHCLQQAALDTDLQRNDLDGPNQFISVCREIIISFVRDNFPTHKVLRYSACLLPFLLLLFTVVMRKLITCFVFVVFAPVMLTVLLEMG